MSLPELGDELRLGGAPWRVVDVAPAASLAEMAAALLADEGFEVALFAVDPASGALEPPGDPEAIGPAVVLVPRGAEAAAREVLADGLEDFTGDDAERLLAELAAAGLDGAAVGLDPALVDAFAARRAAGGDAGAGGAAETDGDDGDDGSGGADDGPRRG